MPSMRIIPKHWFILAESIERCLLVDKNGKATDFDISMKPFSKEGQFIVLDEKGKIKRTQKWVPEHSLDIFVSDTLSTLNTIYIKVLDEFEKFKAGYLATKR